MRSNCSCANDVRLLTLDRRRRKREDAAGGGRRVRGRARRLPGGVSFVALGSVTEEGAVAREIAYALGLRHTDGRPLVEAVAATTFGRRIREPTLLVLDNFEQLIAAAPLLVGAARRLRGAEDPRDEPGRPARVAVNSATRCLHCPCRA